MRAELVVLVLRPALERMVVALVAVEAHAEKRLADVLRHLARLPQHAEIIRGGILISAAFREQNGAHELVVRHVLRDALAQSIREKPTRPSARGSRCCTEAGRPICSPSDFTKSGLPISSSISFSRFSFEARRVRQESAHAFRLRRQAGEIERHAADEFGVGAKLRRQRSSSGAACRSRACR